MTNTMDKKKRILTIIGLVIISLVLIGGLIFGPFNSILPDNLRHKLGYDIDLEGEIQVNLLVDFSGAYENINLTIVFLDNQSATAYTILLQANLSVDVDEYPNGIYILGIEGIHQNSSYAWWYFADGVDGSLAADKFDLRSNGVGLLEWRFTKI